MAQFNLKLKHIVINKNNNFIINEYLKTLQKKGLIEIQDPQNDQPGCITPIEGKGFDANLLPSVKQNYVGLKYFLLDKAEFVASSLLGSQFVTFELMEIDVDNNLEEFYKSYTTQWTDVLNKASIDSDMIESGTINEPELVIAYLLQRLVAYTLSESNLSHIKHNQYFKIINAFVNAVIDNAPENLFRNSDRWNCVGEFLLDQHNHYIDNFNITLKCRLNLNAHKSSLSHTQNVLDQIEKLIIRQLIAYWKPNIKESKLGDSCYLNEFDRLMSVAFQKSCNFLEIKCDALDTTERQKQDIIVNYYKKEPHGFTETIIKLCLVLQATRQLKSATNALQSFIVGTGWMGIICDVIDFSDFSLKLKSLIEDNLDILNADLHGLPQKCSARNALITYKSKNAVSFSKKMIKIVPALYSLNDPKLHEIVIRAIFKDVKILEKVQQELGINIINVKRLHLLQPKDSAESSEAPNALQYDKPATPNHPQEEQMKKKENAPKPTPSASTESFNAMFTSSEVNSEESIPQLNPETVKSKSDIMKEQFELQQKSFQLFEQCCKYLKEKKYEQVDKLILESASCFDMEDQLEGTEQIIYLFSQLKNSKGDNLLHFAVRNKLEAQMVWLIGKGISVLSVNSLISEETPLSISSDYILSEHKNIFYILCSYAQKETAPKPENFKEYKALYKLTNEVVKVMHEKFVDYNKSQKDRASKEWYELLTSITQFFGQDYTIKRAYEVSLAYKILFDLRTHQDYELLMYQFNKILEHSKQCSKGSVLHTGIRTSLKDCDKILSDFRTEYEDDHASYKQNNFLFFSTSNTAQGQLIQTIMEQQAQKQEKKYQEEMEKMKMWVIQNFKADSPSAILPDEEKTYSSNS